MTTVTVDVEVDFDSFSDEDLVCEVVDRGYAVLGPGVFSERCNIENLRMAVLSGDKGRVYEMAAQIADCAHLLPPPKQ